VKPLWIAVIVAALTSAPPQPGTLAADVRQRVSFATGASSAMISGSIMGRGAVPYVLSAKAGQTMSVTLETDNGANSFNVLPPGSEAAIGRGEVSGNQWTGVLPVDGEYVVDVFLMRSAARRNETANYTLTVGITGSPAGVAAGGDGKVAGTPYHATGKVPCSVGTDPKGSEQCSFGVIRRAPGSAEVSLAPAGYDVTLHPDQIETVLIFSGTTVTSRDPARGVSAQKQGDDWSIAVDNFHYYSIPEAVIVGG
jgi:hypothetical protein